MRTFEWSSAPAEEQLDNLRRSSAEVGVTVVSFRADSTTPPLPWARLEPWTRTRSVTVADVRTRLTGGALEVALLADVVCLRAGSSLHLPAPGRPVSVGLLWALGRAGRRALAVGLLLPGRLDPAFALELGLAQAVLSNEEPLPIPGPASLTALTAARDLARAEMSGSAGRGLEHATFRFLCAAGDCREGALAFLERREPRFERVDDDLRHGG